MSGPEETGKERPVEREAARKAAGGRTPGWKSLGNLSHGTEVLLTKAAVDPQFRQLLLEIRTHAAKAIGLQLSPSEVTLLETIPQAQLEIIISQIRVDPKLRPVFMGKATAAMLAALGAELDDPTEFLTLGIGPDVPPRRQAPPMPAPDADAPEKP